jgi:HlyD family secretion protein
MMMHPSFALLSTAKQQIVAAHPLLLLALSSVVPLLGCSQAKPLANSIPIVREVRFNDAAKSGQVLAQGRLQPAKGIIRLAAIPGDRVEQILVQAGQAVRKSQSLLILQSQKLRALELEAADVRLVEARAMLKAKQQEAELAIDAAGLKMQSAVQMLEQAKSQLVMVNKNSEQLDSLNHQISSLQKLRELPLTRAAIGTMELESKKNELSRISTVSEQSILAAKQAVELSTLQVTQSERALAAAKEARKLIDQSTPIGSLEKQIEILKMQLEQSNVVSPVDGIVVSVNIEVGERTAQLPMFELADLSEMVCVAEVHESDVASLTIDDQVEIRSSALGRPLKGRVKRIDRVVGAAQMRSPNPMARSDFRSIPVWIAIDASDTETASQRLQLQVDVSINKTR